MKKQLKAFFVILLIAVMAMYAATGRVCVTKTGKKYHRYDCKTLARSTQITELTIEQAKARGYEPCKVCNP